MICKTCRTLECGGDEECVFCRKPNAEDPGEEVKFKPVAITDARDRSVKEILQHMLERSEEFHGVIVAANCKNGEQYLRSSKMDLEKKSYLMTFIHSWVLGIFKIKYDDGETD